ncbi:hypothetical protein PQX77_015708 [Marasmius sp. AFHP31]|nr:hypothetical protein PQX77_015708 [Marasmius sp. AFHP31]
MDTDVQGANSAGIFGASRLIVTLAVSQHNIVTTKVNALGTQSTSDVGSTTRAPDSERIQLATGLLVLSTPEVAQYKSEQPTATSAGPRAMEVHNDAELVGGGSSVSPTTINLTVDEPSPIVRVQASRGLVTASRDDPLEVREIIDLTVDSPEIIDLTGDFD